MNARLRVSLGAVAVLALLAGCRTTAPVKQPGPMTWSENEAALLVLDRYSMSGRVAVAAGEQGFSGSLRYQQQPQRADLSIDGPLGMGGMHVAVDGEAVSIETSRGDNLDGGAARDELERRLGFSLPLQQLRWWLLGIPQPKAAVANRQEPDPPGQLQAFDQDGWHVSVQNRAMTKGLLLPQKMTIEREGARLKLVVDKWQP